MKTMLSVLCMLLALAGGATRAQDADFGATTETVGQQTGGFENSVGQLVTPAGTLVKLPGVRPNALALSPDGSLLVTAGLTRELLVLDPASGKILQHVPFPSAAATLAAPVGSPQMLSTNQHDKLSLTGIAFSPDGSRIYLANVNGDLKVFGVARSHQVSPLSSIPLPAVNYPDRRTDVPAGLAVSPDGRRIYVALNVANQLAEIDTATGGILRRWNVGVSPFAVVVCRNKIYVSNWGGRQADAATALGPVGADGTVRVDNRSIASEGSVSVIDLEPAGSGVLNSTAEILTGRHAGALALSPDRQFLVCANAGDDTLSVIDTTTDKVVETISARQNPGDPFGAQPDALAFDRQGRQLFVCNGSQNAVAVIQFGQESRVLGLFPVYRHVPNRAQMVGLIPVGWFPGAIAFDLRRNRLDIANLIQLPPDPEQAPAGKGNGPGFNTRQYYGSLSLVDVPSASQLQQFTQTALANLRYPVLAQAKLPARPNRPAQPVPERVGEPSVFQHVLYIIKENRSYDEVLGDAPEGNGDPALCVFGEHVTPNQHKFTHDYVLLDNTYCSGILSADGHQWTDSALANEYVQRSFAGWPRSYPGGGGDADSYDALAYSTAGFIWNDALEHGRTVCDFGEFTSPHHFWKSTLQPQSDWLDSYHDFVSGSNAIGYYADPGIGALKPYALTNYIGFDLTVPDVVRAAQFAQDFKQYEQSGQLPNLIILWLPNDHTSATKPGEPTPAAQVADNDLAFGQIVETLSRSQFWSNTCVFAVEDDPQDGWDHVSGYRTTAYVVSPYTKRHQTIHTQYNQTSIVRTIELILGLPPMNQLDATATPMFDCFTNTPDFTPYVAETNRVPLDEMNPEPKRISDSRLRQDALISAKLPLDKEDQVPEDLFNHILWRALKGPATPYPATTVGADDD